MCFPCALPYCAFAGGLGILIVPMESEHVFLVCIGRSELVEVQVPLVVGGPPNMKYPRFQVWGACLEKVCCGLRT